MKRLRRTWGTLRPLLGERRWRLAVLVAASILTGIVEAGILVVIAQVAFALTRGDPQVVTTLGPISVQTTPGVMLIAGASLAGLRVALQVAVVYMPARIGADVQSGLRRDLFDTFVRADWPTQASDREGHLQELLGTHVMRAVQAVEAIATGMAAALTFVALIVSALSVNVLVGLLLLLVGAALFLSLRPLVMMQRRHARRTSEASLDVAASASEAVRVGEEIQVFGVEEPQAQRFSRSVDAFEGPFFKMNFFGRLAPSAYQSLAMLLLVGGLGILVALGSSRLAALGTVVLILVRSLSYGQQVQGAYSTLNQLVPFVERIREATEAYRGARPPSGRHRLRRIDRLELRSVGYSYGQGLLALEGVRGEIRAGTAVGIVGPSGVGKSTLVQVLLRLREPTEGSYLVNDHEASVWLREDWRSLVAAVPQEPKLIAGTVADNIRFFRPGLDDEAVERAARLAHVHDEITARPGGYEGRVGQRADALSGGQRQRLCVARALAADPQVLILDEPTSALDARSEELILESLQELKGRLTLVVVAHRLALLEVCDQVWEMKEGGMTSRPGVSRPAGNVMKVPRANRFGLDT